MYVCVMYVTSGLALLPFGKKVMALMLCCNGPFFFAKLVCAGHVFLQLFQSPPPSTASLINLKKKIAVCYLFFFFYFGRSNIQIFHIYPVIKAKEDEQELTTAELTTEWVWVNPYFLYLKISEINGLYQMLGLQIAYSLVVCHYTVPSSGLLRAKVFHNCISLDVPLYLTDSRAVTIT